MNKPLPKHQKLNVLFRVEPGCLGPKGSEYVDEFCAYAEKAVEDLDADFVHWTIVPRNDKQLPEVEYSVNSKKLTHNQAARYLEVFEKQLDEFEGHLDEKLALLIDEYFGR